MADQSRVVCQRCKGDRLTFVDEQGNPVEKVHMVMTFAIPADAPMDIATINKLAVEFAKDVTRNMLMEREKLQKGKGKIEIVKS